MQELIIIISSTYESNKNTYFVPSYYFLCSRTG